MPPRRAAAAKAASIPPPPPLVKAMPLDGTKITIAGSQRGYKQADIKALIESLGGEAFISKFQADHTHLLISPAEYKSNSNFVTMARQAGIPMVNLKWLLESKAQDARQPEATYLYEEPKNDSAANTVAASSSALPPTPPSSAPPSAVAPVAAPVAAPAAPVPARTRGGRKRTATAVVSPTAAPSQAEAKRQKPTDPDVKQADEETGTSSKKINVPVDDFCTVQNAVVHIGDDGTVYDASLNQTNAGNNNNKFYRIQILRLSNGKFMTWTRWGRVGERGQSAALGSYDLASALSDFESKFKSKSGLKWENRNDNPKPSKYVYIERNYEDDDDDDDDDNNSKDPKNAGGKGGEEALEQKLAACTLLPPVQKLMELIFDKTLFAATMSSLNYDANKLPLGKLSKTTISRGFQALKDLSALFDDPSTAMTVHGCSYNDAVARLSNLFYSLIPHAFGRNRPPVLQTFAMLKKEIELLESLSDMKDAELLMKAEHGKSSDTSIHPADKHYSSLNMQEMTPLDHNSTEFTELASYLNGTRGATHSVSYQIEDIFRIQRHGEQDRFDRCLPEDEIKADTRLLWHGSRATNFGGILGQGLRIAPPEAPVNGYMFGKGIYLADMSSKSAGYCIPSISKGTGLLLLCEAKLGSPMLELTNASPNAGAEAKAKGLYTTLGKGKTGPLKWKDAEVISKDLAGVQIPDVSTPPGDTNVANACLLYNEYIVYDVSQVRLRYLFRVKMQ